MFDKSESYLNEEIKFPYILQGGEMNKIKDFLLLVIAVIAIAYSIELISIRRELMLALLEWLRGNI